MAPDFQRPEPSMWVGNVPSNTTEEELLTFVYNAVFDPYTISNAPSDIQDRLPLSVFLISYTNCAFVNFSTQHAVRAAIAVCNGRSLRPWSQLDTRTLLCKERTREQYLLSGVNVQRGKNVHSQWSANIKQHAQQGATTSRVTSGDEAGDSTDSEALAEDYPVRYFILKSFTVDALDACLRTGIWRTQRHNEGTLDKAFRTSSEVILLFSANESKGFRCFGRMATRIQPERHEEPMDADEQILVGVDFDFDSSLDAKDITVDDLAANSATRYESQTQMIRRIKSEPEVSTMKHLRSTSANIVPGSLSKYSSPDGSSEPSSCELSFPCIYPSPTTYSSLNPHEFRIEWLCTSSVPFRKLAGLRNPWNAGRSVQVARDGIDSEIEPSVGRKVIARWRKACRPRPPQWF